MDRKLVVPPPFGEWKLGTHLTQSRLGRSLPPNYHRCNAADGHATLLNVEDLYIFEIDKAKQATVYFKFYIT